MKNRGRKSRLFMCFRPGAVKDDHRPMRKYKFPSDSALSSLAGGGEEEGGDKQKSTRIPSLNYDEDFSDGDLPGAAAAIGKDKSSRRFPGALKSVMSDIFLQSKKMGSRRFRAKSLRLSSTNSSKKLPKIPKTRSQTLPFRVSSYEDEMLRSNSSRSSTTNGSGSSISSSSSSSISPNLRSISQRKTGPFATNSMELKQQERQNNILRKKITTEFLSSNIGLSLIVLSLLVLIIWGKVCAILCTSLWLFCIPGLSKGSGITAGKSEELSESPDIDSGEYKKRVIMEGLLDRNRGSRRL